MILKATFGKQSMTRQVMLNLGGNKNLKAKFEFKIK